MIEAEVCSVDRHAHEEKPDITSHCGCIENQIRSNVKCGVRRIILFVCFFVGWVCMLALE